MNKKRILVIEDNTENLRLEQDLLEAAGYEVLQARDGKTGIAMAGKEQPDLIVMDVRLPDIRGTVAAEILRQDEKTENIPIIFVTASVMEEGTEKIKSIKNSGFISKPINTRTFVLDVGRYIK